MMFESIQLLFISNYIYCPKPEVLSGMPSPEVIFVGISAAGCDNMKNQVGRALAEEPETPRWLWRRYHPKLTIESHNAP